MRRRTLRAAVLAAAAASLGATLGLAPASTPTTAAFACTPDLSQACAVVFGPLCRRSGCY